jgi:hypothetical protein
MTRHPKRRNPNGASGNKPSPRRGEKTKQTRVSTGKETNQKVVRQTQLSFKDPATPTVTAIAPSIAITPDVTLASKQLHHPTPPPTPDRDNATPNATTTATETAPSDNDNEKKAPAKAPPPNATNVRFATSTAPTDNNEEPLPPTLQENDQPTSNDDHDKSTPPNQKTTKKPKKTKKKKHTTDTDSDSIKPTIPLALQSPSKKYTAIRYDGTIDMPPSEDPYGDFLKALKEYFKIIHTTLGKDILIASWDSEQETSFPPLRNPDKIPPSRESLGIYLGGYINPKQDGSKVYLNLRLITFKKHPVPMEKFGIELQDGLSNSKHKFTIRRQPRSCQAARSECIGWMMYSCKSMNSETFIPALKLSLRLPDYVEVGIQYRTIALETGKKPPFDKENPPAAAIHLDIDEKYALLYQSRAASLWRKNSKQRLPNGVQLRLVPCFTSATGKSMTDTQRSDAKTLLERQYYFVKEHLKTLPAYFFISQLDSPISPSDDMTLRRAMMSRSPKNMPTSRLIHNVDASWNRPGQHVITSVIGRDVEAQRFLINMIPEFLHQYGEGASKWFTGAALLVYKEVKWNPDKGTTSSAKERNSEEMVKEDLWDLTSKWSKLKVTEKATTRPDANALNTTITTPVVTSDQPTPEQSRLASDKSVASFGNVYARTRDEDDTREDAAIAKEAADNAVDPTGTQFEFSPEQLERDRLKAMNGPPSTGFLMSTAAKTTDSTRLKLKEAKEEIYELKKAAQEEILALKQALAKQAQHQAPKSVDSPEDTPETNTVDPMQYDKPGSSIDDMQQDEITEHQALGAALSISKKRATFQLDHDGMEEDNPIPIGSSSSENDDDSNEDDDLTAATLPQDDDPTTPPRVPSSQQASGTDTDGTSSSSSESSSSSDSSSDESSSSSHGSYATADLVAKLTPIKLSTTTKTLAQADLNSGSAQDPAVNQLHGQDSGLRMAHPPPPNPSGLAGDLNKDAGPSV